MEEVIHVAFTMVEEPQVEKPIAFMDDEEPINFDT